MAGAIVNRVRDAIMADMLAPHEIAQADPWLIARYEHTARVAIEAMREPTGAMKDVGYESYCRNEPKRPNGLRFLNSWTAMIDAALAEKE